MASTCFSKFPKLGELMDQAEEDVLAFMHFPKEHWPQLASTNTLERLNKELKRRARVIGIFPNDAAIVPRSARADLLGTLMAEQTDEWQVTRRYMAVDTLVRVLNRKPEQTQLLEGEAA
jgi:transposase-like protein